MFVVVVALPGLLLEDVPDLAARQAFLVTQENGPTLPLGQRGDRSFDRRETLGFHTAPLGVSFRGDGTLLIAERGAFGGSPTLRSSNALLSSLARSALP